jgi:hypothetical protein
MATYTTVIQTDPKFKLQNGVRTLYLCHKCGKGLTLRNLIKKNYTLFIWSFGLAYKKDPKILEDFKLRNHKLEFYCVCVYDLFYST